MRPKKGWLRRSRAIAPRAKALPAAPPKQPPWLGSNHREAAEKDDLSSCTSPATTATGSGSLHSMATAQCLPAAVGGLHMGPGPADGKKDEVLEFIATHLDSLRLRAAAAPRGSEAASAAASGLGPCSAEGAPPAGGDSGQLARLASGAMSQRSSQLSAEIQQWEVRGVCVPVCVCWW